MYYILWAKMSSLYEEGLGISSAVGLVTSVSLSGLSQHDRVLSDGGDRSGPFSISALIISGSLGEE